MIGNRFAASTRIIGEAPTATELQFDARRLAYHSICSIPNPGRTNFRFTPEPLLPRMIAIPNKSRHTGHQHHECLISCALRKEWQSAACMTLPVSRRKLAMALKARCGTVAVVASEVFRKTSE
jgi:hypothetical protein